MGTRRGGYGEEAIYITFTFLSEKSKAHKSSHFCKMMDMCTEQWWPSVGTAGAELRKSSTYTL